MTERIAETEIGRAVVKYFDNMLHDVYQEVRLLGIDGKRADIVAVDPDRRVVIVECKVSLTFDVIAAALHWQLYHMAHRVYIAVMECAGKKTCYGIRDKRATPGRSLAYDLCKERGVGVIVVKKTMGPVGEVYDGERVPEYECTEVVAARWIRPNKFFDPRERTIPCLLEEHKTWGEAGNAKAAFYSPFTDTCRQVAAFVAKNPGCSMREAVENCRHHYPKNSSAVACLTKWARAGKVKGIRTEWIGNKVKLFPAEAKGK